jgi:radical SAM protein with 4Fe4S-binding SPASM domain
MTKSFKARIRRYLYIARSYAMFILSARTLSYPRMIQIQTESLCNARCEFCPYSEVSKNLEQGIMERDLFNKIIEEVGTVSCLNSFLFELHNEPLLDDRVFEFIKYVKQQNRHKECTIVTNGQLLDRFKLTEIADSNLDRLTISLNAYSRERYEECCGLYYDKILSNIDLLLKDASLKRKLVLSFVVTQQSAVEIQQSMQYWKKRGVKTRTVELVNRAGTLADYKLMKPPKYPLRRSFPEIIGRFFIDRAIQCIGCYEPFHKMNILFNGDVIICCHDWNRTTVVGNLKESSVKEIWNSPKMNRIRSLILKKKYSQIISCKNCSLAK